jgi:hypothetical protein
MKKNNKIVQGLSVLIPTCRDNIESSCLDSTLVSISNQTYLPQIIYLRDEGDFECFKKSSTRMIWNLLSMLGVNTIYIRSGIKRGVAIARKELANLIDKENYVLWLDDDMILEHAVIENLVNSIEIKSNAGFVQGQKIELNPSRKYKNDINTLNGMQNYKSNEIYPIYFGDAAILLVRATSMKHINWDVVTKYATEGLAGEDVAMSLMISDKQPCFGVPAALGWHISPEKERWNWESSSDALQIELLKGIVSDTTLKMALPHLKEKI